MRRGDRMDQNEKLCAICGSKTEEGFILDFAHQGQTASRWVAGKPERMVSGVVAFSDRQNYHVAVFRCENCGHLEFFAIEPPIRYAI